MLRRFRRATILAVAVAVLLLGVPLAIFGYVFRFDSEVASITTRADQIVTRVDRRLQTDQPISAQLIDGWLESDEDSLPAEVYVATTDNLQVRAGATISGRSYTVNVTSDTATVSIKVSSWGLIWRSMQSVWLVLFAASVAIAAGIFVASRQARRLTAPLVYLAASAEQLGAGQVRPRMKPTGIEEIDLVASELVRSADRMAGKLAAERQFASDASHQLRTPLTALSMRLEEIQQLATTDEVREEARISLEQIERLVATVDELLTRSRQAATTTSSIEALHLSEVAQQQREEWEAVFRAEDRDLVIDVPGDLTVLASPGALAQVLATLLENSLKHGAGITSLVARPTERKGGVVIEVADQGAGVSDELAPRIFERNVTSGGGTGIGLALARDLVAADGGRLELARRRPAVFAVFLGAVRESLDPDVVVPPGRAVDPKSLRVK